MSESEKIEVKVQKWYCPKCDKTYPFLGVTLSIDSFGMDQSIDFCMICWINLMKKECGILEPVSEGKE